MDLFVIGIIGLIIGSFLNVCIFRIPINKSIVLPRSHCMNCKTTLSVTDLIPIISYLGHKGKCQYCGIKISIQYPLVEILNMCLYIILYYHFAFTPEYFVYAIICSILLVILFIDLHTLTIPDVLTLLILLPGLFLQIYKGNSLDAFLGFIFNFAFFLAIAFVSRGGMGGGDIKLVAALGVVLGLKFSIIMIMMSFILGGTISFTLLLLKIKTKKDPIPFGPFIAAATFATLLYGDKILAFYNI